MSTTVYSAGSKGLVSYENEQAWPVVTKVLNVLAFNSARRNRSAVEEGIDQRASGYPLWNAAYFDPKSPNAPGRISFRSRGMPQLSWFEGTYEIPAHSGSAVTLCKYPQVVGPKKNGKRMCLAPGTKLSPEDEALKKAEQIASDKSFSDYIAKQGDRPAYTGPVVRGLGGAEAVLTQYEKDLRDKQASSYRTTEYALIGVFLAGAFLIWRS